MEDAIHSESAAATTEPLAAVLKSFWDKNEPVIRGLISNPPIFYHRYPNSVAEVASFRTPSKAVPSLLHHHLGSTRLTTSDDHVHRLREAATAHCTFLVGGKGCGKTRLLYEVLSQSFGFYFKASNVENGESGDFIGIIETLKLSYPAHDKASDFIPRRVAVDATLCAVLARLVIFAKFLEIKPELSPVEWLVFQTECRPRDLYWELTLFLIKQELPSGYLEEKFSGVLREVYEKTKEKLACGKLLFVMDEVQSHLKNRFQADNRAAKLKSLVWQALKAFRTDCSVPVACILAGTGTELLAEAKEMETRDYMNSSPSFEISCASDTYEDPGRFQAFSDYLSGFLGPGDYQPLFDKYYQSRAGTIATALHQYINKRIPKEQAVMFLEDFGHSLATKPGAQINVACSIHDTLGKVVSDRFLFSMLRDVTEVFYLGGKGYSFAHNTSIKLVELGLAVLRLPPCGTNVQEVVTREAALNKQSVPWDYGVCSFITEKIVQASLAHHYVTKVKQEMLERYGGVQSDTERAAYFDKYCPVFLLDLFSREQSLEKLFLREGEQYEEEDVAELSQESEEDNSFGKGDGRAEFRYLEYGTGLIEKEMAALVKERVRLCTPEIGTPLMVKLGQSWTFERWLNAGSSRPTFLQTKTDNQFGPDLVALLQVPKRDKELLLSIQVRPGMAPDRLNPQLFFVHNKLGVVAERNRQNSSILSRYWENGWVELLISPSRTLQRDERPFPADKMCVRASIDRSNLYRLFPKLLDHIRRR